MYRCTSVPVHRCTCAPVYWCTGVPVYRCTSVLAYRCTMSQNRKRFMHRMSVGICWERGGRNSKNNCSLNNISVLVYQCISVSVPLCTSVPVYLCTCALVQRLSKKERDGDFVPEGGGACSAGGGGGRANRLSRHACSLNTWNGRHPA